MRTVFSKIILTLLLFGSCSFLYGQNDTTSTEVVKLELEGGSILIGTIVYEDSTSITLRLLSNNETTIDKNIIVDSTIVSKNIKDGEYWIDDPNSTRLFFAPTGRGLKSGQGYFAAYEVLFPMIAVAVTDYLIFAGGISLMPGADVQLLYLAPKAILISQQNFDLAIGWLFVGLIGTNINDSPLPLNLFYTIGTYSFEESALTGGIGLDVKSGNPMLMIGGELRISQSSKLLTENWFILDSEVSFISLGIRFFGESLAADFGFMVPFANGDDVVFIPWLGFAYNF